MPNPLDHDRCCAEIIEQTRLLREALAGAGLAAPVPTCPEWDLRALVGHLGSAHHWAAEVVRTRAAQPLEITDAPGTGGPPEGIGEATPESVDRWLAEGAELLAGALREAGPDAAVWSYFPAGRTFFYARRMAHETAVHRADVCLATGVPYALAPDHAADAVEEWLEIVCGPTARTYKPGLAALDARAGDTLHLHATDAAATGQAAEWVIEVRDDGLDWRRAHERSTVAVRGPVTSLLLALLGRPPKDAEELELLGDETLWGLWREKTDF